MGVLLNNSDPLQEIFAKEGGGGGGVGLFLGDYGTRRLPDLLPPAERDTASLASASSREQFPPPPPPPTQTPAPSHGSSFRVGVFYF